MSELQLSSKLQYIELLIDSSQTDRSESSQYTPLNWPLLNFEDRLLNPAGLKVASAEVPINFDTLLEGANTIKVTASTDYVGSPFTFGFLITITPGNYTADDLATELRNKLNEQWPGWTITWNNATQKYTFQHIYDFTFDFADFFGVKTLMYKFMGFEKGSVNTSSSNTLTSTNAANPSGPTYMYLNSRYIGQEIKAFVQNNGLNSPSVQICRIPINAQRGGIVFYTDPTPNNFFDFVPGFKLQSFDLYFTIEDVDGTTRVVDFKGLPFSVKIALLNYREGGSSILARPNNSRFVGA